MTGSPALWEMAEVLGVVPAPPDATLAGMLADWHRVPRRFGCATARADALNGAGWTVVAPDLRVWCARCAGERFADERRCVYCGKPVRRLSTALVLAFEMDDGGVRVLGRAHRTCAEQNNNNRRMNR